MILKLPKRRKVPPQSLDKSQGREWVGGGQALPLVNIKTCVRCQVEGRKQNEIAENSVSEMKVYIVSL